ncbi:MAG: hypothetical protein IKL85_07740 [Lentisphaeria bacterium]|nr:hypothetical protein [Lentisphaeria bacterium]
MSAYQYINKWASGSQHKVSADVAYAVVSDLAEQHSLTARNLVDVSRAPEAPLHDEFEWDDSIAGEEWRKEQARHIIAHLIHVEANNEIPEHRAFFKIEKETSNYVPFESAIRNENSRQSLLDQALKEFTSFRRKYSVLTELAKVFEDTENAIKQTRLSV